MRDLSIGFTASRARSLACPLKAVGMAPSTLDTGDRYPVADTPGSPTFHADLPRAGRREALPRDGFAVSAGLDLRVRSRLCFNASIRLITAGASSSSTGAVFLP